MTSAKTVLLVGAGLMVAALVGARAEEPAKPAKNTTTLQALKAEIEKL